MLKNYKKILLIAIAVFVVFAVGIILMPKKEMVVEQNKKDGSKQIQTEQKELMEEQKQTQTESEQVKKDNSNAQYDGVITKEEDGWKRYRNEYYGIEFRFQDEEDVLRVGDSRYEITVSGPASEEELKYYPNVNKDTFKLPYIYITFNNYTKVYGKNFNNLEDYLNDQWDIYQNHAELVSINELENDNIRFYEVFVKLSGGVHSPDKIFDHKQYYTEYEKFKSKDYLEINCNRSEELCNHIVDSLQFIK